MSNLTQPNGGRAIVTQEYALEAFSFDEKTGKLYWKSRPRSHFRTAAGQKIFNSRFAGKEVCSPIQSGHLLAKIGGRSWLVHRLVWLMHTGELPGVLDHINRNPSDNRLENLRPCSRSENMINTHKRAAGKIAGVYEALPGIWEASLKVSGRKVYLGHYRSREEARQAYEKCVRENYGAFVPNV